MPKVSVIMGVYNSANKQMLVDAIESILNQSYEDFEFIICDDGSTDDTYVFLKEYIKKDKRCKLIKNNKNCGLAYSLNHCLSVAKGEYIARMDADDISEQTRFEEEVKFLQENSDYSIVGTAINLFDEKGIFSKKILPEKPSKYNMLMNAPFVHPSVMIRALALKKIGGYRVAKETKRCEDYDLWMRMFAAGEKGYNIPKVLFNYREDRISYKKRKYKYRIDEAKVRYKGFKMLGLLPKGYLYVVKPLVIGLLPQKFISRIKLRKSRLEKK